MHNMIPDHPWNGSGVGRRKKYSSTTGLKIPQWNCWNWLLIEPKYISENFYPNFNCSTNEFSFEGFEEYKELFRQIPTNLRTIVRKCRIETNKGKSWQGL